MPRKIDWDLIAPHPSNVMAIGRPGMGKSVLMGNYFDYGRRKGLNTGMVGDKSYAKLFPKWVKFYGSPQDPQIPLDSITGLDDAYLYYSSRKRNEQVLPIAILQRQKRQGGRGTFITLQESTIMDIMLIRQLDAILFKRPKKIQLEMARTMEREGIGKLFVKANEALEGVNFDKKYVYVYSDGYEGLMTHGLPKWWTEEISKGHRDKGLATVDPLNPLKAVYNLICAVGRL